MLTVKRNSSLSPLAIHWLTWLAAHEYKWSYSGCLYLFHLPALEWKEWNTPWESLRRRRHNLVTGVMVGKHIAHEYSVQHTTFLNNSWVNIDAIAYFVHSFFTFNVFWHEILEQATWILCECLCVCVSLGLFNSFTRQGMNCKWYTQTCRDGLTSSHILSTVNALSFLAWLFFFCDSLTFLLLSSSFPSHLRTAYFIVASSIYGQLLVVICLSLLAAKNTTNKIPVIFFEVSVVTLSLSLYKSVPCHWPLSWRHFFSSLT